MPAEATPRERPHSWGFPREGPELIRVRPCGLAQPTSVPGPLLAPPRPTLPSEPILFPKLRIQFADFPYLHCSRHQRLFTLETCCGYWVRPTAKITLPPSDFQGPTLVHRTPQEPRCFTETTSLSPDKPIPGSPFLTKKRKLFPGPTPTSPSSVALPHWNPPKRAQSPRAGSGILTRFPFDRRWADARSQTRAAVCDIAPLQNGILLSLRTD